MTRSRLLALLAALAMAAALTTSGGDAGPPLTASDPSEPTATATSSATPAPPHASRAAFNRQDRTTVLHRRREARVFDARPLLARLPLERAGVRIDIAGLTRDGRRTRLLLERGRRSRRHARAVYRRALVAAGDSGRAYVLEWRP